MSCGNSTTWSRARSVLSVEIGDSSSDVVSRVRSLAFVARDGLRADRVVAGKPAVRPPLGRYSGHQKRLGCRWDDRVRFTTAAGKGFGNVSQAGRHGVLVAGPTSRSARCLMALASRGRLVGRAGRVEDAKL
jgi:hypothetical protein